jgi:toxin CcdB
MVTRHRQFDVFANPDRNSAAAHPYLIVLQSDALFGIDSCVVAPLVSPRTIKHLERLLPEVSIDGKRYVVAIPDMAAIPTATIGNPVTNLDAERYRILSAIDLIFVGL